MASIEDLYQKFLDKRCSREEAETLLRYFREQPDSGEILALIRAELDRQQEVPDSSDTPDDLAAIDRNRETLRRHIFDKPPRRFNPSTWALVAASAAVFLSVVFYIFLTNTSTETRLTSQYGGDVAPGSNRAYITLSDGQRLELDSNRTAVQAIDGQLLYEDGTELASSDAASATITTPVGGEYQLILPDGTKAWLNAASSLTYPVRFTGKERKVEISGEVYLEVKQDQARSFRVITGQQRIEVLGTSFNIRNYSQRTITTLVQGSIALENNQTKEHITLTPGDQSILAGERIKVSKVEPSDYIAWKDGIILNKDATLKETCAELERWYGVRFIFPEGFKNAELALNSINRDEMLSSVLAALKNSYQVDFVIKGKEVFVR